MSDKEKIQWLVEVNEGQGHGVLDTLCRLIGKGKEICIAPGTVGANGIVYPSFSVTVRGDGIGVTENGCILSDVLSQVWTQLPEVQE